MHSCSSSHTGRALTTSRRRRTKRGRRRVTDESCALTIANCSGRRQQTFDGLRRSFQWNALSLSYDSRLLWDQSGSKPRNRHGFGLDVSSHLELLYGDLEAKVELLVAAAASIEGSGQCKSRDMTSFTRPSLFGSSLQVPQQNQQSNPSLFGSSFANNPQQQGSTFNPVALQSQQQAQQQSTNTFGQPSQTQPSMFSAVGAISQTQPFSSALQQPDILQQRPPYALWQPGSTINPRL